MQPKYAVGDIFYAARDKANVKATINKYNFFLYVPVAMIITQIIIDRKGITYKVKGYIKENENIASAEVIKTEKELDALSLNFSDVLQRVNKELNESFIDLTREINKKKLSDVLHGE